MANFKADACGHGLLQVAKTAVPVGADWQGFALLVEA